MEEQEQKKKPKTAVLAFVQGLSELSSINAENPALEKKMITNPLQSKFNLASETQLFTLPSGRKCRFTAKTIDSKKCVVWSGNAREQEKIDRNELDNLKKNISLHGQLVPALVRLSKNANVDFPYEVIYGSRRLKACQELEIPIKVIEADLSDEDALFFMEAENEYRESLSLYEKAVIYNQWLESKIFKTQEELAEKLGLSVRWIRKLLSLLKIPKYVIDALPSLKDLTKPRAERLALCLEKNMDAEVTIKKVLETLKIEDTYYTGDKLFFRIFSAFNEIDAKKTKNNNLEDKVVFNEDGERILTLKLSKSGKAKIEVCKHLSSKKVGKLLEAIEKVAKKI
jgi:ParB/RepB/Spo0J family partition protein